MVTVAYLSRHECTVLINGVRAYYICGTQMQWIDGATNASNGYVSQTDTRSSFDNALAQALTESWDLIAELED